jgi:hypothetical protein
MSSGYFYSSFTSKYHRLFCELGYPQLDVRFVHSHDPKKPKIWGYETGEWAIYEMLRSPVVPHLTPWKDVLTGLKNIEINKGVLKRMAESIDLTKQEAWDREMAKSQAVADEHEAAAKHRLEMVDKIHQSIVKNPDLVERIAKNGPGEMDPAAIMRHIPKARRSY